MNLIRDPDKTTLLNEVVVTLAAVGFAMLGRSLIDMIAPGTLPFALTFPAVIFASLIAGTRSGVAAVVICQMLVWYFVFPPRGSLVLTSGQATSLVFSTFSLGLTVWIVGRYRAVQARLRQEAKERVDLLSLALREVDHRTKNNFQIAASLLQSQAAAQSDPALAQELRNAASRLTSIAGVYADLALSSAGLSTIVLDEYLRELCARFSETMLPPTVSLAFESEPVEVPAQAATTIGLIVNECLTNAAKHAFPRGQGAISVAVRRDGKAVLVEVRDDGVGMARGRGCLRDRLDLDRDTRAFDPGQLRDGGGSRPRVHPALAAVARGAFSIPVKASTGRHRVFQVVAVEPARLRRISA